MTSKDTTRTAATPCSPPGRATATLKDDPEAMNARAAYEALSKAERDKLPAVGYRCGSDSVPTVDLPEFLRRQAGE
jgi:hypothetical protein